MSGSHDRNSPSQLKKRYMCPGSVCLEEAIEEKLGGPIPEKKSEAASRGIVLHHCVRLVIEAGATPIAGGTVSHGGYGYVISQEDIDQVMQVVRYIRAEMSLWEQPHQIFWEMQIDLEHLGIKNSKDGSRVDLAVIFENGNHQLFEFKFGRTWVDDPVYNWQLKAYANGIQKHYGGAGVDVHLLQPGAMFETAYERQHTFTEMDLEAAGQHIRKIVDSTMQPQAPLTKGNHCEWCSVKSVGACPLYRDAFLNIPQHTPIDVVLSAIDPTGVAELYENLNDTLHWIKNAIKTIEDGIIGGTISANGYEVGTGRNKRKWSISESDLAHDYPSLVKESVMSPAEAEKEHGKKFFRENFESYVEVVPGPAKVVKSQA